MPIQRLAHLRRVKAPAMLASLLVCGAFAAGDASAQASAPARMQTANNLKQMPMPMPMHNDGTGAAADFSGPATTPPRCPEGQAALRDSKGVWTCGSLKLPKVGTGTLLLNNSSTP